MMKLRIDCVLAVLLLALALGVRSSDALTLPAGLNMSQITQMGEVLDKCNGDFGDIVSLYMVEATPLIATVKEKLNNTKSANTTEGAEGAAVATMVTEIMESDEFNALLESSTLQRISDELNLTCVMSDEVMVSTFTGVLEGLNVTKDSELGMMLHDMPSIVSGFYECGGRITPVLRFAQAAAPEVLSSEGGFDPMSILNLPSFTAFVGSGFDMGCFFGVPAVGGLVAKAMG